MSTKTFTRTHTVAFNETDAAGFVHFTHYLRWMEEVEHAFLKSLDIPVFTKTDGLIQGWPRVDVHIQYHKMLSFDATITIELSIKELLVKGVKYGVSFYENEVLVAEAEMTTLYAQMAGSQVHIKALEECVRGRLEMYCGVVLSH